MIGNYDFGIVYIDGVFGIFDVYDVFQCELIVLVGVEFFGIFLVY